MNYIFLDIDGVLNNSSFLHGLEGEWGLCPQSVELFSKLCNEYNCKVILSSGWRRNLNDDLTLNEQSLKYKEYYEKIGILDGTDAEKLLNTFKEYNIQLAGKTDELYLREVGWDRIGQINRYIKSHLDKSDKYVIIDNEDIFGQAEHLTNEENELYKHFVRTDHYGDGFDEKSFKKACVILDK